MRICFVYDVGTKEFVPFTNGNIELHNKHIYERTR